MNKSSLHIAIARCRPSDLQKIITNEGTSQEFRKNFRLISFDLEQTGMRVFFLEHLPSGCLLKSHLIWLTFGKYHASLICFQVSKSSFIIVLIGQFQKFQKFSWQFIPNFSLQTCNYCTRHYFRFLSKFITAFTAKNH